LPFRRLLRIAPLAFGVTATMCTPFKEDPASDSHGSSGAAASAGSPCDTRMPFDTPAVVPGLGNIMATSVGGLRLSSDYRTAYFHADGRPDSVGHDDLYTATRDTATGTFGNVISITGTGINTTDEEFDPTVSGNGLILMFARGTPTANPVHIFGATRRITSANFVGANLTPNVNHPSVSDAFPFLREDGKVLYYGSGPGDIYRAEGTGGSPDPSFGTPTVVGEINTNFSEVGPVVTPDDLTIYYASDRTDGGARGDYDIWMATRASTSDMFSAPSNVIEINSPEFDLPTFATRDGCTLYFSSTRAGHLLPYVATRRRRDL
jgi:WD40-like Beta Propeller Repeat